MKDSGNWKCPNACAAGYYAEAKELVVGKAYFDNNGEWDLFEPYDSIDSHELVDISEHRVCPDCDQEMYDEKPIVNEKRFEVIEKMRGAWEAFIEADLDEDWSCLMDEVW